MNGTSDWTVLMLSVCIHTDVSTPYVVVGELVWSSLSSLYLASSTVRKRVSLDTHYVQLMLQLLLYDCRRLALFSVPSDLYPFVL